MRRSAAPFVAALVWLGCAAEPEPTPPPPAETVDAGASDAGEPAPPAACMTDRTFFASKVWGPVLVQSCFKCHSVDGVAVVRDHAKFVLQPSAYPGFLDENLRSMRELSKLEYDGRSVLLAKPTGEMTHGGGVVLEADGEAYKALAGLVARFKTTDTCTDEPEAVSLEGVRLLDAKATFRKAALHLNGRLPTTEEQAALATGGETALSSALDGLLREDAFLRRVEEGWNDVLLTDKYQWKGRGWPVAINLLNGTDYPGAATLRSEWDLGRWASLDDAGKRSQNDAVGREPLHLISYVVANDRPFTEVLTASYALVDDYLAKAYAVNDGKTGLREAQVSYPSGQAVPHAGILSTPAFLNRWPTTPTNRSRARARFLLKNFLATDILQLADRPVDVALVTQVDNPTMNAQQCTVCHRILDPIAGAFRGYDESDYERFRADRPWHDDMVHSGFGVEDLPSDSYGAALPWLARQLVADPRFDRAIVQQVFTMVTGRKPLAYPTSADATDELAAWTAQDAFFRTLERDFARDGRKYRGLVKAIVRSPFYRAVAAPGLDEARATRLALYGTSRLLPPEMLNRKLIALTGVHWRQLWDWTNDRDWLNDNGIASLYGGIDSDTVTERATAPNGVMSNLVWRMATELSCAAVPNEFALPKEQRLLFPNAVQEEVPESAGHPVPGSIDSIRGTIAALYERLLGETPSAEELDAAYGLFYDTWKEIKTGPLKTKGLDWPCTISPVDGTALNADVRRDADGTIRAWMAVTTFLLADHRVLHE